MDQRGRVAVDTGPDGSSAAPPDGAMTARRDFLLKAAAAAFAGVALPLVGLKSVAIAAPAAATPTKRPVDLPALHISPQADEDVLIRMQRDLERALAKPIQQRRWGMVIDTRKCTGCSACTVGCSIENKLPPGVVYRPVIDSEIGTYPNVTRRFLPRPCMQCENPPCVAVCPVGATFKRLDGIVAIDYNACIGCRYCIPACPYQARTFDFGANWTDNAASGSAAALALDSGTSNERLPNFEYGAAWSRADGVFPTSPVGNARKCTFCAHRLDKGVLPMCVTTCIGRATFFGDLNDPTSLIAELAASANVTRLKEELGTEPKVFYLL